MRILFFTLFTFFCLNVSFSQVTGTWKGKFNGKDATMVLADDGKGGLTGSYVSERNNYQLYIQATDNGIDGRGKDRTAGLSSIFTGILTGKNEMSVTITTVWIDQKVEEKVVLKKQD
jgi:hypothetical protein